MKLLPALGAGKGSWGRGPSLHGDPSLCLSVSQISSLRDHFLLAHSPSLFLGSLLTCCCPPVLHQAKGPSQNQITFLLCQNCSVVLRAPRDLAPAHLSGPLPPQPLPCSWVQPLWLLPTLLRRRMVLSLHLKTFVSMPLLRPSFQLARATGLLDGIQSLAQKHFIEGDFSDHPAVPVASLPPTPMHHVRSFLTPCTHSSGASVCMSIVLLSVPRGQELLEARDSVCLVPHMARGGCLVDDGVGVVNDHLGALSWPQLWMSTG